MAKLVLSSLPMFIPGLNAFAALGLSVIGGMVGEQIDRNILFPDKRPRPGTNPQDITIQSAEVGRVIPRIYGTYRIAGNVIWFGGFRYIEVAEGLWLWCVDVAFAICEGPVDRIVRVWRKMPGQTDYTLFIENMSDFAPDWNPTGYRIYYGTETQDADPMIEEAEDDPVPPHRGLCYVVFKNLVVSLTGEDEFQFYGMPQLLFEVVSNTTSQVESWEYIEAETPLPTTVNRFCGWESGGYEEATIIYGVDEFSIVTSPVHTGTYAAKCRWTSAGNNGQAVEFQLLNPGEATEPYANTSNYHTTLQFEFRIEHSIDDGDSCDIAYVEVWSGEYMIVSMDSDGYISIRNEANTHSATATLWPIGTLDVWYTIRIYVAVDPRYWMAPYNTHTVSVYVNGNFAVNLSVTNTRTNPWVKTFGIGMSDYWDTWEPDLADTKISYLDDIVIFNGPATEVDRIIARVPNQQGNHTQWTGHYTAVDERPHDGLTTEISETSDGHKEGVKSSAALSYGDTIGAVAVSTVTRYQGDATTLHLFLYDGASYKTTIDGFTPPDSTTYSISSYKMALWTWNYLGDTWLESEVDDLEWGITFEEGGTAHATQLLMQVLYMDVAVQTPIADDNIVAQPNSHRIIMMSDGIWWRYNLLLKTVDIAVDKSGEELPPDGCDFDVSEAGRIYTGVGEGSTKLVKMYSSTLTIEDQSTWALSFFEKVRVSRSSTYPFVAIITTSNKIRFVNRDTLKWGGSNYYEYEVVGSPSRFRDVYFHENNAFTVVYDYVEDDFYLYVFRLDWPAQGSVTVYSYDIAATDPRAICYDVENDQVLVLDETAQTIYFYTWSPLPAPGGTLTLLGSLNDSRVVPNEYKSVWQRGPTGGLLTYAQLYEQIVSIDCAARSVKKVWTPNLSGVMTGGSILVSETDASIISGHNYYPYIRVYFDDVDAVPTDLATVVEDICEQCGVEDTEVDVTSLAATEVYGYVLSDRTRGIDYLSQLANTYLLDVVESDGKIYFTLRGSGSSVATISESELASHPYGSGRPQLLPATRSEEGELPQSIEVSYIDYEDDWQTAMERQTRETSGSQELMAVDSGTVMTADEAATAGLKILINAWLNITSYTATLPYSYLWLDAADIVTITKDSESYRMRIEHLQNREGIVEVELIEEPDGIFDVTATGGAQGASGQAIATDKGDPLLEIVPCPLLDASHDKPGIYVAVVPAIDSGETWAGALLMISRDNGGSWQRAAKLSEEATIGRTSTVLADVADPWVWDEGNTVKVRLTNANKTLSDADSDEDVLAGAQNWALIGDEVVGFRSATMANGGTYTLSGLLRGRKGTEWATDSHALAERFVLLDSAVFFQELAEADMDETIVLWARAIRVAGFRFVDERQEQTASMVHLKPYAPYTVEGARDGSNNLTITWTRRTRLYAAWDNERDVGLGEDTEAYEVDIYDGSTVVRTIEVTEEEATYTAAEQTTDGITPGDDVDVVVYQLSDTRGRGYGAEATI